MNRAANQNQGLRRAWRPAPGRISAEASRLLRALAATGAYAVSEPEGATVIIRAVRDGVSVGGGRHPARAAEELAASDLAIRDGAERTRLSISAAGRAHLRRAGAAPEEAFRAQHQDLVEARIETEDGPARVRLDASESPLAWLRRRKDRAGEPLLDAAEFEAGERLRRDLTAALMLPSVTVNWTRPAVDAPLAAPDPATGSDRMLAARQRVTAALDGVGSDLAGLLIDLCGFLKGLETIERERDWPPRSGKVVVKLALGRLADHYGLEREARGPERAGRLRAWRSLIPEEALGT